MTRRRADTSTPYDQTVPYELTGAQREAVQGAIAERYQGRKDRAAWIQQHWRGREGAIYARPRYATARTGSQRGSPARQP